MNRLAASLAALAAAAALPCAAWGQYARPDYESDRNQAKLVGQEAKEVGKLYQRTGTNVFHDPVERGPAGGPARRDFTFLNEDGNEVQLGDYFAEGRPVILQPAYYECPILCSQISQGVATVIRELDLDDGDYVALTIGFVPGETPELAAANKRASLDAAGKPGMADDWHFLTPAPGHEQDVRELMEALGYGYGYVEEADQWVHPSAVAVATPAGRISRYLLGTRFDPKTTRLALVEASGGQIGSWADGAILLCFQFDPAQGAYTKMSVNLLRGAALLTVLTIGTGVGYMILREKRTPAPAA